MIKQLITKKDLHRKLAEIMLPFRKVCPSKVILLSTVKFHVRTGLTHRYIHIVLQGTNVVLQEYTYSATGVLMQCYMYIKGYTCIATGIHTWHYISIPVVLQKYNH